MYYTVGEIAHISGIPAHTLRYYDREGLLPGIERSEGGIRRFKEEDFQTLFIIECLKSSGLSIKEIRRYMELAEAGDGTIAERKAIFEERREKLAAQIAALQQTMDLIDYKCWFYDVAEAAGTCAAPNQVPDEALPERFQEVRRRLHTMHRLAADSPADGEA